MDVKEYIASFPADVQPILNKIREIVFEKAPAAVEGFAYQMPSYKLNGKPLLYFACYKFHVGLYATPNAHIAFAHELSGYKQGKGSVQFPLDQPIPYELIGKIIEFKIEELTSKINSKK